MQSSCQRRWANAMISDPRSCKHRGSGSERVVNLRGRNTVRSRETLSFSNSASATDVSTTASRLAWVVPQGCHMKCPVCDKRIQEEHWFCRIRSGDERIAFCSPSCMVSYLERAKRAQTETADCGPDGVYFVAQMEAQLSKAEELC